MNTHPARPQPAVLLIFLLLAGVLAIAGFALWKNPSAQTPQYTVRSSAPSLMLEQPVNELPAVDEFAWNDWANQSSWAALLVWLVALFVLLLAGLPLAVLIFARWHDAGAAWARIISLLLVGYAVWLPTSLGVCFFSRISLAVAFGALLLLDVLIVMWMGGIRIFLGHIRRCGWSMLISETLFLAGFLLFALLRAHNPDLWHPIWGGEKPMEFAFLNAILRSPVMPPYDPFFSDGTINYYYYGLYLVALPIKATGITSSIAFNLVIPTLFALTLSGGYAIVRQLTGRVRYGLAGGAFLALLGNMASVVKTGWSQGMEPVYHALLQPGSETWTERLSHLGTRLGDWYIGPSRVITEPFFTINEFPFWSFLFADLHPHLIALPIALLVIALIALVAGVGRKGTRVTPFAFLLLALALGTLAVTNSWDFPTYALLMGIALVGSAWRSPRRTAGDGGGVVWLLVRLAGAALLALLLAAAGMALYTPFFTHYHAFVSGVGRVNESIPIRGYLVIYGLFLAILLPVLPGAAWRLLLPSPARRASIAPRTPGMALAPPRTLSFQPRANLLIALVPLLIILLSPLVNALRRALAVLKGPSRLLSFVSILVNGVYLLLMTPGAAVAVRGIAALSNKPATTPARTSVPVVQQRENRARQTATSIKATMRTTIGRTLLVTLLAGLLLLTALQTDRALLVWFVSLIVLGAALLLSRRMAPAPWYTLLLATMGLAVSLGIDLVYIRDHLDNGLWYRMNTVFKFGMQIWTFFALAAAASLPLLLRGLRRIGQATARLLSATATPTAALRRRERVAAIITQAAGLLLLAPLVAAAAVFLLPGTASRLANRFEAAPAPTLDGLAFLRSATFTHNDMFLDLAPDAAAIAWLNQHISGTPIVLQSGLGYYREYGARVAANTGLPTLFSPLHEYEQRDPSQVSERDRDVDTLFKTTDADTTLRLLADYRVNYIYIGTIERAFYPERGLQKFETTLAPFLEVVYKTPGVQIYRVVTVPLMYTEPAPFESSVDDRSPPPPPDTSIPQGLSALEEQVAADPTNAPLVFELAHRYRAQDRYEDAERVLAVAAPANPNDTGLYHLWGDVLADLERYDEAEEVYTQAAVANPTSFAWYKLGSELLQWGKKDKAEIALVRALTIEPVEPQAHYALGQLFVQRGEPVQATKHLRLYLQLEPDGPFSDSARSLLETIEK